MARFTRDDLNDPWEPWEPWEPIRPWEPSPAHQDAPAHDDAPAHQDAPKPGLDPSTYGVLLKMWDKPFSFGFGGFEIPPMPELAPYVPPPAPSLPGPYTPPPAPTPTPYTPPPAPEFVAPKPTYGEFVAPTFEAPTPEALLNDPSYRFRFEQGQKALETSAAARGTLLTGATAKALQEYGQQFASTEYQNLFNRTLAAYDRALQASLAEANLAREDYDRVYRAALAEFEPRFREWIQTTSIGREEQARLDAQAMQAWQTTASLGAQETANFRNALLGLYGTEAQQAMQAWLANANHQLQIWSTMATLGARHAEAAYDAALRAYMMDYDIWARERERVLNVLKYVHGSGQQAES